MHLHPACLFVCLCQKGQKKKVMSGVHPWKKAKGESSSIHAYDVADNGWRNEAFSF
jgi:hypothetical protein